MEVFQAVRHSRTVFVLIVISFTTILGYGAQRVLVPIYLEEIGLEVLAIGLFLSFFGLVRAVMNILGGYFNDLFSKKRNLILSVIFFSILPPIGLALSSTGMMIGFWRIIMAIGLSWGTTTILTILAIKTSHTIRGSIFGLQKISVWSAIALVSVAAPALMHWFSYSSIMISFSFIGMFSLVWVMMAVKEPKVHNEGKKAPQITDEKGPTEKPKKQKKEMKSLYVSGFVSKFIEDGVITTFLPLFILSQLGSGIKIGLYIFIYTLLYAFFQPIGGWCSDKWGKWNLIAVGNGFLLLGLMVVVMFPSTGLLLMAILTGIGSGIIAATAEARASMIVSEAKKGFELGLWRFYRDLGSFFGPIAVGVFLSVLNTKVFLLFSLVMVLLSFLDSLRSIFISSYENMKASNSVL